ncbi:OmpA family protein [Mucilaginibacter sp.]
MKTIISLNIILIATLSAFGQAPVNTRLLADKAFANKDYYEAAYYYKQTATGLNLLPQSLIPFRGDETTRKTKPETSDYISYQLAESYRLYENYLEAEPWYYKVVSGGNLTKYPLARLWYGICLRANQHFDEAIKQLQLYIAQNPAQSKYSDMAYEELRNCQFAKQAYLYPALLDVNMMNGKINIDGSDYAPVMTNGMRYFTSSRMIKNDKRHLNRIYTLPTDANAVPQMVTFSNTDDKKEVEYGTPTIDPTGKRMYMTRWYKTGSKTIHAIYLSRLSETTGWGAPVKLGSNINVEGFQSIQPFITADGKRLFFVSTKPGGVGGDDIWVSDLDADGLPVNSRNLGPTVNTPQDEEAPYYDMVEKKLIYSSKGFTGLGGFDFFVTYENMGQWSTPKNMGYPMNSAKDDLYYLPDNNDRRIAYVSSDRESDCCLNLFTVVDHKYVLKGLVTDCDTHIALAGVKVSFVDSLTKETINQQESGTNGVYTFSVTNKRPYSMVLEKKGYFTKILPVPASGSMKSDTLVNPDICLQAFVVNKPIVIKNVLYDYAKSTLRPESETVLDQVIKILQDNPTIKIELSAHTDSIGSDAYNLKLSQDRAQSCVDYMISKGIPETRIFAKGYGKSRPIASNSLPNGKDNPDGRQLNRRTEFTVLKVE